MYPVQLQKAKTQDLDTHFCVLWERQPQVDTRHQRADCPEACWLGGGKEKFAVFAYATALELQEELIREYPKLAGYEQLRAPESGGRKLVVIDMPHNGYSVEYLQAVVNSAKIIYPPSTERSRRHPNS